MIEEIIAKIKEVQVFTNTVQKIDKKDMPDVAYKNYQRLEEIIVMVSKLNN